MAKKILLLVLAAGLAACASRDLSLKIRYAQIHGLVTSASVLFDGSRIGEVTDIYYTKEGHYLVSVRIKERFANAVTESSRFSVIEDPQRAGAKAIEMIRTGREGAPLADGAVIDGTTVTGALLEQLRSNLDEGIRDLQKRFDLFLQDLKGLSEGEEMKRLEREVEMLTEEMKRSGEAAREKIRREILPRLRQELERLRERLRDQGREKELEPLEKQVEDMTRV